MNYLELPVYRHKDLILEALAHNQVIVVESPTGSGKTTQIPVILYEAGYAENGIIGVTQPRRIAAMSVSEFIARQMETEAPDLVGYKMRFEDKTTQHTKIKIMTDGILLQEMKLDPWLSKYSLLMVDEAHERSLNIDFILGLLKRILETRRDFKVIISSATINAQVFAEYFGERPGVASPEVPVVKIDAVTYPITLIYDPPAVQAGKGGGLMPYGPTSGEGRRNRREPEGALHRGGLAGEAVLVKIEEIVERFIDEKREGDILIFLPGEKMIKDCMGRLAMGPAGKRLHLVPLYGRLGKDEQERVFDIPPRGKTKAVIATNIAETSVTIDGITAVIDSGLSKLNYYNPRTFTSSLVEAPISKAAANQRKGRAGRTREGSCYRLYSRKDFESRPLFTTEDIFRTDLSEVALRMADLGVTAFEEFDFISPPGREGLLAAVETLNLLDALEADRTLSKIGAMMTEFPLPPRQSRIIVEAILRYPDVTQETIIAAAFLSTQSPYVLPPGEETDARRAHHRFRDPDGDFVSYLKLFRAYGDAPRKDRFCEKNYLDERAMAEIANVTGQLEEIVSGMGLPLLSGGPVEDYLSAVAAGLIQFVCVREGREMYRSLTADHILIHPGSVMFKMDPQYIVAGEIIRTTRMYAMSVSPLPHRVLERLKDGLFEALGGTSPAGAPNEERRTSGRIRDFTNTIKLGSEVFSIKTVKGKKSVLLPWEKLSQVKDDIADPSIYKNLRGTVVLNGAYTLLQDEKLSLILSLIPTLEIDGALNRVWPRKASFNSQENPGALLAGIPLLVTPAVWRPGKKVLGFICLFTDGAGTYWFKCSRGFHTSLNESLSALESLIDELGDDVDIEKKQVVNQTYRRLSDYLT
ncbi:MAG: ATP-dependent RNA helicase [Spirochaetaceae bacterium]|jgi:HrpA-like RNA helicase|nr:ATP-dependent RNA helicase [Spirochaetaceae bacterium]